MERINQLQNIEMNIDFIRILFINLYIYIMNFKILNINKKDKKINSIIYIFIITILCEILNEYAGKIYGKFFMIMAIGIGFAKIENKEFAESIVLTIISFCINHILFFISVSINFIIFLITKIENEYISIIDIIIIYIILFYMFFKIKKVKNGIGFIKKKIKNNYLYMMIINICLIIIFLYFILSDFKIGVSSKIGTVLIFSSTILIITIFESLQMYYKHNLLVQDLEETKKELEDKKNEIAELEKEILESNKRSHTIAHKQRALEHKIEKLMYNSEIAEEIDLKERLNNIVVKDKKESIELPKSGVELIDDMLEYMQSECIKNKIDFQLKLSGNIYSMVNNYIKAEDLETLIADHIKDAIIAIQNCDSENKSILVRLGKIDGEYGLYVYDSGIEFKKDTLFKLGKEPITTHKDNGGTGMGFMNTFDTLNKYKASLVIKEIGKPVKDNFTKVIMIKFDNKNEFKIESYREKEFEIISK